MVSTMVVSVRVSHRYRRRRLRCPYDYSWVGCSLCRPAEYFFSKLVCLYDWQEVFDFADVATPVSQTHYYC